jgi:hypothetical protein
VNGILNGYEYQLESLKPGQSVTVSARQFTKKDGTRFNPLALKPTEFYIHVDVDATGTRGVWQGGWKHVTEWTSDVCTRCSWVDKTWSLGRVVDGPPQISRLVP